LGDLGDGPGKKLAKPKYARGGRGGGGKKRCLRPLTRKGVGSKKKGEEESRKNFAREKREGKIDVLNRRRTCPVVLRTEIPRHRKQTRKGRKEGCLQIHGGKKRKRIIAFLTLESGRARPRKKKD